MKQLLTAFVATGLAGGAMSLIASDNAAYADAFTTGSVRGVVKDKASGEPTVGATVVATSTALQGEQVVITDESGGYYLTSLPPGMYTLTVYYNDTTYTRDNVLVQVGKEAVVNIAVDSSAAKGETINIAGTAPIVDQGSTKVGSDDHVGLHQQHPDRTHVRRRHGEHRRRARRRRTASRSPAQPRPRTRTSSKASTRRTPASACCRRTCRTSSCKRPRSSPVVTTPSSAARRARS